MRVSIDSLAKELIAWFEKSTLNSGCSIWRTEEELINDFAVFLNMNSKIKAAKKVPVYVSLDKTDLVLFDCEENTTDGIIAEFEYDSGSDRELFESEIHKTTGKMAKNNLIESYQATTCCIISMYNDLSNRKKLHENDFIEVFNNLEIGCAIKRLR